jgi:hypothetical protein
MVCFWPESGHFLDVQIYVLERKKHQERTTRLKSNSRENMEGEEDGEERSQGWQPSLRPHVGCKSAQIVDNWTETSRACGHGRNPVRDSSCTVLCIIVRKGSVGGLWRLLGGIPARESFWLSKRKLVPRRAHFSVYCKLQALYYTYTSCLG